MKIQLLASTHNYYRIRAYNITYHHFTFYSNWQVFRNGFKNLNQERYNQDKVILVKNQCFPLPISDWNYFIEYLLIMYFINYQILGLEILTLILNYYYPQTVSFYLEMLYSASCCLSYISFNDSSVVKTFDRIHVHCSSLADFLHIENFAGFLIFQHTFA